MDCWLARGRVPEECGNEQYVAGVEIGVSRRGGLFLVARSEEEAPKDSRAWRGLGVEERAAGSRTRPTGCGNPGCSGSLCTIGDENRCGGVENAKSVTMPGGGLQGAGRGMYTENRIRTEPVVQREATP
ncbi:hypothetical protein SUBVAR_06670 [Subdoligranulum variabile DSM 15176]|uniref:Uncharacterized protein n=1 Tax=Subdoligranulum variabile DSM 15176 TaxID=411471 RepID=D1PQK1_9FIRM|nr:hypothetical protein SUBVAR_06670 [Subdoligranulum variabile DSM 15176]